MHHEIPSYAFSLDTLTSPIHIGPSTSIEIEVSLIRRYLLLIGLCANTVALSLPDKLSETGLYSDINSKTLAPDALNYVPQYPLWSDGAKKSRWISLPAGQKIGTGSAIGPTSPFEGNIDHWLFPVGTRVWKEFAFKDASRNLEWRRIETRYMEKIGDEEWVFASYLWNEKETEATLVSEEGQKAVFPTSPSTVHDIPSTTDCLRCHRKAGDPVLGFDALQLSDDRDPLAPHAEPLPTHAVTLRKLLDRSLLSYPAPEFAAGNVQVFGRNPQERAVLGYLSTNCASCHNASGSSMHIRMDLRHSLFSTNPATENALINTVDKLTSVFNFPGENKTYRVKSGDINKSALYQLMISDGTTHMPPIGVAIRDREAIELIKNWIEKL